MSNQVVERDRASPSPPPRSADRFRNLPFRTLPAYFVRDAYQRLGATPPARGT